MARIHARTKGKSGSTRPVVKDVSFVKLKDKEIVSIIQKLAKEEDMKPSKIGLVLRDTYGVPDVKLICKKSISEILKEGNLLHAVPEDLEALVTKAKALRKHLEKNKRDTHNKRGLILIESRIRRLVKYYKKHDKLPENWSYD